MHWKRRSFMELVWKIVLLAPIIKAEVPNTRPLFVQNHYSQTYEEEQPVGTFILQVSAVDNEGDNITYSLGSDSDGLFAINAHSGNITAMAVLDREAMDSGDVEFTVYAYDDVTGPEFKASVNVRLTVLDINDHSPQFVNAPYTAKIKENAGIKSEVIQVSATDEDQSKIITFSIVKGNDENKFAIGPYNGDVFVFDTLDYETTKNYTLEIQAKDGGLGGGLTASTSLVIEVEDADDLPAQFSQASYTAEVKENSVKGTSVVQVTAYDGDLSLAAPVTYLIDEASNPDGMFLILSNLGVITVNGSLDREYKTSYLLRVGAQSTVHNPVYTTVSITVTDVNDNPPQFTGAPYAGIVQENSPQGVTVLQVTAQDADAGTNKAFGYSLMGAGGMFGVTDLGYLVVTGGFDRETREEYNFQVMAQETQTSERLQAFASVTVNVTDVNDNNPQCSQAVYKASIQENLPNGTFVCQVVASDADLGHNAQLRYSLVPDARDHHLLFTIDPVSGDVYTTDTFDREKLGQYTITVRATDQPMNAQGRFGECSVQVLIGDENDNSPSFVNLPNDTSVSEAADLNTNVFQIQAVDVDDGVNAAVSYSLLSGNTGDAFTVDTNSGILKSAKELNREALAKYTLEVRATDGKGRATTSQLTVHVADVNDNAPVFSKPQGYSFSVDEAGVGLAVGTVEATDIDEGVNADITYSLKSEGDHNKFSIDPDSGLIKTAVALDRESVDQLNIRVIAADQGSPAQAQEVPVTIDVTDVNDHRPAFSQRHYTVEVVEQEPAQVVLNLTANDNDIGANAALTFSILSGNLGNSFTIGSSTGRLSTNGPLDREQRDSYVLLVRVADLHGNQSYGRVFDDTAVVEVIVRDVNDHSPMFEQLLYHVSIHENITTGTQIIQVVATDRDLGHNMKLQYSLVGGNELERFLIDEHSGQVYVQRPVDRDPPNDETAFLLKVMARDSSNYSRNATTQVNVIVFDVNDSPPEFESASYVVNLAENATLETVILQPECSDRDSGDNGDFSFEISAGNDEVPPKFSVDSVTGALSVASGFDFDQGQRSYKITLTATDKGSPPLSGNTEVTIDLENVNDNTPEFTKARYHFSVREGSYAKDAKIIGRVSATDADRDAESSAIGQILYSFANQSGYYRDHQWPLDKLELGKFPDVRGGVDAEAKNGANTILDPVLGRVASLNGEGEWVQAGDFKGDCVSEPSLCAEGLSVAFWLNFTSGRYVLSSGGQSEFATGFAFFYDKEAAEFVIVLATNMKKWTVKIDAIPQGWYYVTFTWSSQSGLRYFQDGRLVSTANDWAAVSRGSDIFTLLAIGKPNSIDSPGYYGKLAMSDLMIWKTELTEDEVLHSYWISRHVTGESEMPTAPQYIGTFAITPDTGEIDVVGVLDRESRANYSLDVTATDLDPVSPRHNSTVVVVEVLDVNDNAPVFGASSYAVDLEEHSPPGKPVLKVEATDADEGTNGALLYSIVSGDSEDAFRVESLSGEVTVAKDIDRERVPEYRLGVQAEDGGTPSLKTTVVVTVTVTDVNDNSPLLTASSYAASVGENLPAGQSVLKLSVNDPDDGANGELTFSVDSGKFSVNASTAVLYTTQPLDRELQALYQVTVRATDGGASPKSGEVQVQISVKDENDNAPRFSAHTYQVAILENSTRGTWVLRVTAADPDEGSNGHIAYTLQGGDGVFSINRTSGVITVIATVDREANPSGYSLTVTARDHGYPRAQTSSAIVNVTVSDVNDNAPIFDKFTYSGVVAEDSPVSTPVTSVRATDRDEGLAGQILYSIVGGNEGGAFAINSSGTIAVAEKLDRESKAAYELTIEATDRAGDTKSATVEVDITVTDANDNPPIFGNIPASILVSESAMSGTPVFTVVATDQDLGVNGDIHYSGDSPEGQFAIDRDTGVISTVGSLDFEQVQRHVFYVVASDSGVPPLTSSTLMLNITVVDTNDNNPMFTQASYSADVHENETVGYYVITVNATERDSDLVSRIGYNISGGDLGEHFALDYYSGEIRVQKPLDREKLPVYNLLITATDNGVPPRFGQTSVTIHVLDINDHVPMFKFKDYQQEVSEDSATGKTVLTVDAVDQDSPDVTRLVYSIVAGNGDNHFTMETIKDDGKDIGAVVVEQPLDREQQALYKLTVSVSDGLFSSNASAEILLSDVNDCFPEFSNSTQYSPEISENSPADLHVLRVTATDLDLGLNAKLTYSLRGADGKFTIDPTSADIRTTDSPLDRELKSVYHVTVVATDNGGKQGEIVVPIRILDQNDNAPVFRPPELTVDYVEGPDTQGLLVIRLNATDPDAGENQLLTFSIVDGNLGDVFAVDNITGVITANKPLDREEPGLPEDDQERGVHTLIVEATDHGNPAQSTSTVVTVRLQDINDNPPVFPPNGYHVMISEGAKAGEEVIAAVAADKDAGDNEKLTYELISGNTGGDFMLDPSTAMVKTTKDLQRQQTFSYNLTIGASDHGRPSFSATTKVYIVVGDVNDNDPVFHPVNYSVSVNENAPVGTPLVNVTATDADNFQNAQITYTVTSGDSGSVFTMETQATYGTLVVAGLVDREHKGSYTLQITAADGGVPISRKAQATVVVSVLDQNDNRPQFSRAEYRGTIVENAPPGRAVHLEADIRATDADSGLHGDIRYFLNGSESHQFAIDSLTGQLRTRLFPSPTLDYEKTENYTFYAVAVDERGKGQATFVKVVVEVLDTNDNIPHFFPFSSEATISEDVSVGYSVARMTATDSDSEQNGFISYYIISGGVGKFRVGRQDGIVRVAESLDRESYPVHTLNISAVDGSYHPKEGYGILTVILDDVNDNAPKFAEQAYEVGVSEDVAVGRVFVNVTAADPDFGTNAAITYSMSSHPVFDIDSSTGGVRATQSLDRETEDTYSFIVYAEDGGGLVSSVAVNVVVHDVNDNSPHFLTDVYRTDVLGNTPVGTVVLVVVALDEDSGNNGRVEFSVSDMKEDLFSIGAQDGLVRLQKPLSRLELQQSGVLDPQGRLVFHVVARDKGNAPRTSSVSVVMTIVDSSDDSPVFNRSSYVVYFDENQPPGTPVVLVRVAHQRPGSELTFSIASSQSEFAINNETGLITSLHPLDRESRDQHVFTVQATDNGQTPLRGYSSVVVYVTDANDNSPEFQFPSPYKMAVPEDAPLGTGVGRLVARDEDAGVNGQFEFAVTHANIGPGLKMVSVNAKCDTPLGMESGEVGASDVTASSTLVVPDEDYSATQGRLNNKPLRLNGVNYQGAWCAGVNDQQQYIQVDFSGMRKVTKVSTQGRPGTSDYVSSYFLQYSADGTGFETHRTRFPGNSNGDLEQVNHILPPFHARAVRLQPDTWAGHICLRLELYGCESDGKDEVILPFILNPDTGLVNVSSKLDREQQDLFVLIVEAKDKGVPSQNSTTTLEISVTDSNDNAPEFSQDVYEADVPENAYGGYEVARVRASDADEGSNAAVRYEIVGGGQGKFMIEEFSGIVRPSGPLDYESMPVYKFYLLNVSATDGGRPARGAWALLNISVTDFNDNEPAFNQSAYAVHVKEDVDADSVVYVFAATDADSGANSEITYRIEGGDGTFSVGSADGKLRLERELDRESEDQFRITITASDNGVPQLSSSSQVVVHVTDVNDNAPVFTSRVYSRKMTEGVEVETIVATVTARDIDAGQNGAVRYEILDGNQGGHFSLDAVSGAITLEKPFDREENGTLTLTVEAKDLGIPELSDQALVKIFLTDVNDNAPKIQPKQMDASVLENSEKGTLVFDVNATDADIAENGQVHYVIMHGAEGKFVINSTTGVIETAGDLDRETKDLYTLIVMARDQGQVPFMDFGTVDVRILDANDNTPSFSRRFGPFSVTENEPSGTVVGKVSAEDEDIELNADITYTITDGDSCECFAINGSSGEISTAKLLDRETKAHHDLTVTATNLGSSPPLSSSTSVRVNILDTNDFVPEFGVPSYNRSISEGARPGTSVVIVSALDEDEGTNGRVFYNLLFGSSTPGSDVFGIHAETGLITLRAHIDEQEHRHFTLLVEAKDIGLPQALSSTVPVYVTIDDVNDNQPVFEKKLYSASTSETTQVGTYVARVRASDADAGTNAALTYRLVSGDERGNFGVNASDGGLFIQTSLDRETQAQYLLVIAAYNLGAKAYNDTDRPVRGRVDGDGYFLDTTEVSVQITDVNDNPPVFVRSFFTGGISESAELNTFIMRITATDEDVGNNSALIYRIASDNDGGFFTMEESTGVIRSASLFRDKKGQWFEIMVTAFDNHGKPPNNQAEQEARVRIYVLLDEQRVTLRAEVDPSLIEENKEEFVRAMENITESQVYIEAIFKVFSTDSNGDEEVISEVVFHAVKESTQTILTSSEVLSTISKNDAMLQSLYAKWKIQYVKPSPAAAQGDSGLSNAELALIIIGSLVALCLLLGLCFAIKTRCRGQTRDMYNSPSPRRKGLGGQSQSRLGKSWSYYDDAITTIENKSVAPVRVNSTFRADTFPMEDRPMGSAYSSEYLLSKKRLPSGDDKLWNEAEYYMSQESKIDSYLDDDGESDNAARSDVSHSSSGGNARMLAMNADELPVTKV